MLGLDEKTLSVYEALLVSGASTVAGIAQRAGLKRPTTYLYLDQLIKSGLVERVPVNTKMHFRAVNPGVLEKEMEASRMRLENLKRMHAENHGAVGRQNVRTFEGLEHIRNLYLEIARANSIRSWFSIDEAPALFDEVMYEFTDIVRHNKTNMRDIVRDDPRSRKYAEKLRRLVGKTYSFRVQKVGAIENDTIVYGDCVAIFGLDTPNLYAIRIEDRDIAQTFRTIFDVSWSAAREVASRAPLR